MRLGALSATSASINTVTKFMGNHKSRAHSLQNVHRQPIYQATLLNPPSSHSQNPPPPTPFSARTNSTTTLAPSTGSFCPLNPLNAVLQCPGLATQNSTSGYNFPNSSVSAFSATFETEYGMQAVGGRVPEVMAWREARAEERFMTRGEGERDRRGRRRVVRVAGEVRFVKRVVV